MTDETIPIPDAASAPDGTPSADAAVSAPSAASSEPALLSKAAEPSTDEPPSGDPAPETPIAYETFKLPEGVTVDPASLTAATELFRASALSQEQAQKFVDLAVSREQAAATRSAQAFVDLQNKWVSEIKADPDIGGDRLDASLASARRAIDRLGVPGLREALNLTGAGNHPAIVKAFVRLGQMVSEDRFLPGKDAAPAAPRSPAEIIYDGNPRR